MKKVTRCINNCALKHNFLCTLLLVLLSTMGQIEKIITKYTDGHNYLRKIDVRTYVGDKSGISYAHLFMTVCIGKAVLRQDQTGQQKSKIREH